MGPGTKRASEAIQYAKSRIATAKIVSSHNSQGHSPLAKTQKFKINARCHKILHLTSPINAAKPEYLRQLSPKFWISCAPRSQSTKIFNFATLPDQNFVSIKKICTYKTKKLMFTYKTRCRRRRIHGTTRHKTGQGPKKIGQNLDVRWRGGQQERLKKYADESPNY